MRKLLAVAGFAAIAAVVPACGGTSESAPGGGAAAAPKLTAEEAAAAKQVAAGYMEDTVGAKQSEADCLGERVVKSLGVKRVVQLDWSSDTMTLPVADATTVYDAMAGCIDLRGELTRAMSDEGGMTDEEAACVAKALSDANIKALIMSSLTGEGEDAADAELDSVLEGAAPKCMGA